MCCICVYVVIVCAFTDVIGVYTCICVYVTHQSQWLRQQKLLPCLEQMARKDSNDLLTSTSVIKLISFSVPNIISLIQHHFVYSVCLGVLFSLTAELCVTVSICAGGRGVVVGPIVSNTLSDIFCNNEHGPNFLFKNNGDGTFIDVAQQAGKSVRVLRQDSHEHDALQLNLRWAWHLTLRWCQPVRDWLVPLPATWKVELFLIFHHKLC